MGSEGRDFLYAHPYHYHPRRRRGRHYRRVLYDLHKNWPRARVRVTRNQNEMRTAKVDRGYVSRGNWRKRLFFPARVLDGRTASAYTSNGGVFRRPWFFCPNFQRSVGSPRNITADAFFFFLCKLYSYFIEQVGAGGSD